MNDSQLKYKFTLAVRDDAKNPLGWCLWFNGLGESPLLPYSACLEIYSGSANQIYKEQINPYFEEYMDDGSHIKFKVYKDGTEYNVVNEKLFSKCIRELEALGGDEDGGCEQFAKSNKSLVWMENIREQDSQLLMFPEIRQIYVAMVNYWNSLNTFVRLERL